LRNFTKVPYKKRRPDHIRSQLQAPGLKARKSLGQNFLIDEVARDCIMAAASLSKQDTVLEIGPGPGILTSVLVEKTGSVIAVELDVRLAVKLQNKFAGRPNFRVVNADILKVDLRELLPGKDPYKVVGNIPYYITSPILHYFMFAGRRPELMVIMMQKEVAEEVTAAQGKMSYLSAAMQLLSRPEIVCRVPAASFYPQPKVDSAVVRFNMLPEPVARVGDKDSFLQFLHAGFAAPRKQMRNSLAIGLKKEPGRALALLEKAGISPELRPGALSLADWSRLYRACGGRPC